MSPGNTGGDIVKLKEKISVITGESKGIDGDVFKEKMVGVSMEQVAIA